MNNSLVNQTRWSDLLKQLAVLKGLDHVELSAVLQGGLLRENDRPEHKYLAGEALAWGQFLLSAIAAVVGFVGVRNPAGSGKIVILEKATITTDSGASTFRHIYYALARGATLTAQNTEQPRDTRLQPTGAFGTAAPGIVGQVVSGRSDTIVVTPFVVGELLAAFSFVATSTAIHLAVLDEPVVLAPGDSVLFSVSDAAGGSVAALAIQGSFFWRERTLEPTET